MAITKTIKQPFESYSIYGDFTSVMEALETIDEFSSTVLIVDKTGEVDETVMDGTTIHAEGFKYFVKIKDGTPDKSPYRVSFRITTSNGNKWEVDGEIVVKEV